MADDDDIPDMHHVVITMDGKVVHEDTTVIKGIMASFQNDCDDPDCTNNHARRWWTFQAETLSEDPFAHLKQGGNGES